MKKRLTALGLIGTMLFTLLTGCGGSGAGSSSGGSSGGSTSSAGSVSAPTGSNGKKIAICQRLRDQLS